MKKRLYIIFVVMFAFSGCGRQEEKNDGTVTSPQIKMDNPTSDQDVNIDLDLTMLSSTMVYAEVYNIMMEPESYVGKTIKMEGLYYADNYTDKSYHFVIISDATACCAQGLEFIWLGDHSYPKSDTEVEVVGIFESYEENGQRYYRIDAHKVENLDK